MKPGLLDEGPRAPSLAPTQRGYILFKSTRPLWIMEMAGALMDTGIYTHLYEAE